MSQARACKRVAVCVDDFGLSRASCMAAIELASGAAISAVSSVVDGTCVESFASALKGSAPTCSVGMHLNITEHSTFQHACPVRIWIARAVVSARWRTCLQAEINRQLDRFERLYQRPPAFVDGHEHVHQLRVVREPLCEVLCSRYRSQIAVRSTVPCANRGYKARAIAWLGGYALRDLAGQHRLTANRDFAGVYDFTTRIPYERRMHAWLASINDGGLVMCHPEHPADTARADLARVAEFAFFLSPKWQALRTEFNLQLVPFTAQF